MKAAAEADVNATRDVLVSVSHELWEHPELAFEEEHAAKVCIDALSDAGFSIRTGVAGMETAFISYFFINNFFRPYKLCYKISWRSFKSYIF